MLHESLVFEVWSTVCWFNFQCLLQERWEAKKESDKQKVQIFCCFTSEWNDHICGIATLCNQFTHQVRGCVRHRPIPMTPWFCIFISVYFHHCSDWDLFKLFQGTKKHDHVGLFVQVEEQQAQRKENLKNRGISTECFWTIASETNFKWKIQPSIATVATLSENAAWREGPRRSPRCSSAWALRAKKLATWIQVPTRLKRGQTWVRTVYFLWLAGKLWQSTLAMPLHCLKVALLKAWCSKELCSYRVLLSDLQTFSCMGGYRWNMVYVSTRKMMSVILWMAWSGYNHRAGKEKSSPVSRNRFPATRNAESKKLGAEGELVCFWWEGANFCTVFCQQHWSPRRRISRMHVVL